MIIIVRPGEGLRLGRGPLLVLDGRHGHLEDVAVVYCVFITCVMLLLYVIVCVVCLCYVVVYVVIYVIAYVVLRGLISYVLHGRLQDAERVGDAHHERPGYKVS